MPCGRMLNQEIINLVLGVFVLVIQCFRQCAFLAINNSTIVIDSWWDIEKYEWEATGAKFTEDSTGLPDCVPGEANKLPGNGIWWWDIDCASTDADIKFKSKNHTYQNAESITLKITYFAMLRGSSTVQILPVKCSDAKPPPCFDPLSQYTEENVWSITSVQIDVQHLPIVFNVTLNSGDWLLFEKIEILVVNRTMATNPPTTSATQVTLTEGATGTEQSTVTGVETTVAITTEIPTSEKHTATDAATTEAITTTSPTESTRTSEFSTSTISVTTDQEALDLDIGRKQFYESWWFISLCISCISLLIFLIITCSQLSRCKNLCEKSKPDNEILAPYPDPIPGNAAFAWEINESINVGPNRKERDEAKPDHQAVFTHSVKNSSRVVEDSYHIPRPKLIHRALPSATAGN